MKPTIHGQDVVARAISSAHGAPRIQDIILVSGAIASGKTSLCDMMATRHDLHRLKTRDLIQAALGKVVNREELQKAGERLDHDTGGSWVATALVQQIQERPPTVGILIDAIRTESQVTAIRRAFGSRVLHIHLIAPLDILAQRYISRCGEVQEPTSYAEVKESKTEAHIDDLASIADVVIDTHRTSTEAAVVQVASLLRLLVDRE